jgi:hypothetical protein
MPSVFRAPEAEDDASIYDIGDSRGYYDEDCYIARPDHAPKAPRKTTIDPREAYTSTLKQRFRKLHDRLQASTEAKHATNTEAQPFVPQPQDGNKAYVDCLKAVQKSTPQAIQLQSMSQDSTFATLELIDKHYLQRGKVIDRNTSAWLFALLARLDDVGSMANEQVSVLREMGKRAVIVQISFNDASTAAQLEDLGVDQPHVQRGHELGTSTQADTAASSPETGNDSTTVEHADASLMANIAPADKENTLVTLDMILAIIGEMFGQRDLLEFRRPWTSEG